MNFGFANGAWARFGAGVRVRLSTVSIFSFSLSAAGFRLSDCSYRVLVKVSASSANFFDSFCFFSSAAISGLGFFQRT